MLLHPRPACRAVARPTFAVAAKCFERVRKQSAFAGRNEQAGFVVDNRLRNPGERGRHNRPGRSHRFLDHGRKNIARAIVIGRRGERENVAGQQSLQHAILRQCAR